MGSIVVNLLAGIFILYVVYKLFISSPKLQDAVMPVIGGSRVQEALGDHRACIRNALATVDNPQMFWDMMTEVINDCVHSSPLNLVQPGEYANSEEKKYHIKSDTGTQEVIVTVGVGKDIKAEIALKEASVEAPVFFGADPVYEENEKVFMTIGSFFPFAVGGTTGIETVKVFKDGSYKDVEAVQIDLVTFISSFIRRTFVDALWLDAEGQEYGVMPMLYKGGAIDNADITLCQINLEIHNPDDAKKQLIRDFTMRIVDEGRYAILQATRSNDLRLYLVNFANENCVSKFVQQFYKDVEVDA